MPGPSSTLPTRHPLLACPFRFALAGVVGLAALTLMLFPPRYESNDDPGMNALAQGVMYSDQPDEHLQFSNVLIGLPLAWLYAAAPTIPWYGGYQIVTVIAAAVALTYLFLRANPSWKQVFLSLVHFEIVAAPCLTDVQFTKTAFLAAESGAFLLLGPLLFPGTWSRGGAAAGTALLVLGSLIRFQSFLLVCLTVAPLGAYLVWAHRLAARHLLRGLAFAAALVLLVFSLHWADRAYYAASPEWQDFHTHNALRATLLDYAAVEYSPASKPTFDAVGWDQIDFALLQNWFFADRERYSSDRMRRLLQAAPQTGWKWGRASVRSSTTPCLALLIGLGLCVLLMGGSWRRLLPAGLFVVGVALAFVIALRYRHLPPHVWFCLFCPAVAAAVLFSSGAFQRALAGAAGIWQLVLVCLMVVLIGWQLVWREEVWRAEETRRQEAEKALRKLAPRPDRLYVIWGHHFPHEQLVRPLGTAEGLRQLKCVGLGCGLSSPLPYRRLADFRIDDLYQALVGRDDVYLICHPLQLRLLEAYSRSRHGTTLLVLPVLRHSSDHLLFFVCRLGTTKASR